MTSTQPLCRWFCCVLILATLSSPVAACLNDRDTLANEANRYPNVLQTITGRFERNPPLYYQMRIRRVAAELKSDPSVLSDYDDVGVACDRIGLDDDAIGWMNRKLMLLRKAGMRTADLKEQWYRYYANTGTFWMHRWARAGAQQASIDQVRQARDLIQHAVAIKPDAHFGREKYQVKVMSWLIDDPVERLGDYLLDDKEVQNLPYSRKMEPVTALCGLVALGSAWESVDVFDAISKLLYRTSSWDRSRLAYFAELRCLELIDQGHGSMREGASVGEALKQELSLAGKTDPDTGDLGDYRRLRAESDQWQKRRTDFMMARLTSGRHPDTDPNFWSGYHDDGPPHLSNPWDEAIYLALGKPLGIEFLLFWFVFYTTLLIVGWLGVKWWVRRYRKRAG